MRTMIIISFFVCIYLHFHSKGNEVVEHDSLSTTQSSLKKISSSKARLPAIESVSKMAVDTTSSGIVPSGDEVMITDADLPDNEESDDLSQLPWDDIEEGWKTHLKEYLVGIDPEKADDMFSAYMEEKKKYVERVDFTDQDPSSEAEPSMVEQDGKEGELERMHAENLKEIFGDHYSQIESLHKEYVDSVQYLNRSSVKFSISL